MPEGARDGILRGMYLLRDGGESAKRRAARAAVRFGRDPARSAGWRRVARKRLERSQRRLERHEFQRAAARRRGGAPLEHAASRKTRRAVRSWRSRCKGASGPGIAATDYIHTFAEQIRPFVGRRYATLGTDGYGRSDYRRKLREFFEVNRHFVVIAALKALADEGSVPPRTSRKALKKYAIDPNKPNPITV